VALVLSIWLYRLLELSHQASEGIGLFNAKKIVADCVANAIVNKPLIWLNAKQRFF